MSVAINWEAVTAGCAALALIGTITALYVKSVVREEITKAVASINGTYTRSALCKTLHAQMETRLATIEDRLAIIEEKAL
ncbi:MAG: hypothetical protein ACE14L_18035 [Terriglobales bacterium]